VTGFIGEVFESAQSNRHCTGSPYITV